MPAPKPPLLYANLALKVLAIAPVFFIALIIFRYSVNVPQTDEWELTNYFQKFAQSSLSLADLFQQHNEYRQFFPNLLILGLSQLTKGDVRYEMVVSFLLACLISLNVYQLGKVSIEGIRPRLWIYFAANLLIFSPIQYENWLQGQQLIYFTPVACLTTGLLVACSIRLRTGTKFIFCGALSFISTFSSANGILCFVLLLPVLVWASSRISTSTRRWLVAGWLAASVMSAGLYFYHYQKPANHPPMTEVLVHWPRALLYFLALLGGPFGVSKLFLAIAFGLILLTVFVWCGWQFSRLRSDHSSVAAMLPWLALAFYSISTAVLITLGRSGFGLQLGLAARYATFLIYLSVALVHLVPIILAHEKHPQGRFANTLAKVPVAALIAGVITIVSLPTYVAATRYLSAYRRGLLQGKACLLFINTLPDDCTMRLYPDRTALRQRANVLNQMGLLRPPLLQSDRIADIEAEPDSNPDRYGEFGQLVEVGPDKYEASGWAILPLRGEPADVVLLSLQPRDGSESVFAIATLEPRHVVAAALLRRVTSAEATWHKEFSLARSLSGEIKVSAWAFDSLTGKAYRLAGVHYIQESAQALPLPPGRGRP